MNSFEIQLQTVWFIFIFIWFHNQYDQSNHPFSSYEIFCFKSNEWIDQTDHINSSQTSFELFIQIHSIHVGNLNKFNFKFLISIFYFTSLFDFVFIDELTRQKCFVFQRNWRRKLSMWFIEWKWNKRKWL